MIINKKNSLIFFIVISSFFIAIFFYIKLDIFYNQTNSFPIGFYKLKKEKTFEKFEMILFCPENTKSFSLAIKNNYIKNNGYCENGNIPLLKKIVGTPGDKISINKNVSINGKELINSRIYKYDSQNRLIYQSNLPNFTIKEDEYFVMSDYNDRSFDSRYFGPIKKNTIIGTVKELLTFSNY